MARITFQLLVFLSSALFSIPLAEGGDAENKPSEKFARQVLEAVDRISDSYVFELNRGEMAGWAITGMYRRFGEKMPPALAGQVVSAKDKKEDDDLIKLLTQGYENLSVANDKSKQSQVFEFAMLSIVDHLAHAELRPAIGCILRAPFYSVGLELSAESSDGFIRVATPIKDGPAYKAGIRAGDVITKITLLEDESGKVLEQPRAISMKGLAPGEVEKLLMGLRGSKVALTITAPGSKNPTQYEMARGPAEPETVLGNRRKANDAWDYLIDPEKKLAYIRLTNLKKNTARDLSQVLQNLQEQGMKGVILDLRFSPGGLLGAAVSIAEMFIKDGLITTIRLRLPYDADDYKAKREGRFSQVPLVCLVNGETKATSEVLAACLQDHYRAMIVGEPSGGEVYIPNSIEIETHDVRFPTALFYRPNGKKLDRMPVPGRPSDEWGVSPDKDCEVKLSAAEQKQLVQSLREIEAIRHLPLKEQKESTNDRQLKKAVDLLREKIVRSQKLISEKEAIETATKTLNENHPRFRVDHVKARKEDAEKRWFVFFEGDRQLPRNHMLVELSLNGDVQNIHRGR
jgi:carboxyl-terminal processing protease